jgi:hypothetical protein
MQRRAASALVAAFLLLASARSARAQGATAAAPPNDAPRTPVVEPLPTIAPPVAAPPGQIPSALTPAQPQWVHQPYVGWAAAGGVVFGISYGLAFIIGGIYALAPTPAPNSISSDVACTSACHEAGALLLVPVAGPLLLSNSKFTLWWSGIQAAGALMGIVGLVGHYVPAESPPKARVSNISVFPAVTPQGGMLSLGMPW